MELPTAKQHFNKKCKELQSDKEDMPEWMIEEAVEFGKLCAIAALEAAYKNAKIVDDPNSYTGNTGSEYPPDQIVDKDSILNSFNMDDIK